MTCPNCGSEVPAEAKFCEHCGAAAPSGNQQYAQAPGQYQAPPSQYQAPPQLMGSLSMARPREGQCTLPCP
ncbi:zinc-ribbon domain-containing protein [Methanomassiliicoccus luminyensis]|uniref:zinc-ribbon domain-containing protein n=1 Tax=Methanomassiliicoccus luminyensis TaxID=1080712 RepID=UPI0009DB4CDA